jgi:hypothetical protein
LRRVALAGRRPYGLGTSEDGKQKHWTLRWATFSAEPSQMS